MHLWKLSRSKVKVAMQNQEGTTMHWLAITNFMLIVPQFFVVSNP